MRPLTETERDALRVEVGLLRLREQRRLFPAELCVGTLAGRRESVPLPWPATPAYDDGLLVELADALWDRWDDPRAAVWLLRPGFPEPHDLDVRLASVAELVAGCRGCEPTPFLVVTRYGWLEPRSGEARRWKRLRLLRGGTGEEAARPQSAQV